jgi:hypothetical protein
MTHKKHYVFRGLSAGIRAMRDHAEGKVDLRTTHVSPSCTEPEDAVSGRTSSRLRLPRKRRSRT